MIQRVQTIYLLCAAALMACTFFMPLAVFSGDGEEIVMRSYALFDGVGQKIATMGPWLAIMVGATVLLLTANIFTYNRRWVQLRLCFSAMVLTLGSLGFVGYYVLHAASSSAVWAWKVAAIFPLAAFIFVLLAARGVINDNRLVKSLDRLR